VLAQAAKPMHESRTAPAIFMVIQISPCAQTSGLRARETFAV
jgi:hypothetical protein